MRDEKEERKKQARSNKQTRQSNIAHPRQSLFLEKMSCLGWDSCSYCLHCTKHVYIIYTVCLLLLQDRLRDTIVHEMCHAAVWVINGVKNGGHGRHWQAWYERPVAYFHNALYMTSSLACVCRRNFPPSFFYSFFLPSLKTWE